MMQVVQECSHPLGPEAPDKRGLAAETRGLVTLPSIRPVPGAASQINQSFEPNLTKAGWATNVRVDPRFKSTVNAVKDRVTSIHQTANVTRGFYDRLKFGAMYMAIHIDSAVLTMRSWHASGVLESNIANFQRVTTEFKIFQHVLTVPRLVLGVDE